MNVLAIGCHPDDIEIGCGGTLAKYVKQGHIVFICNVANGDKGHVIVTPYELSKIRAAEVEEAGKIIGAGEVINLNVPDIEVNSYNEDTAKKIIDVIRHVKPMEKGIHLIPGTQERSKMQCSRLFTDLWGN